MRDKHGVKYGTIRGEGIQRMNDNEVAFYGSKRGKRAKKQFKEGLKDNYVIAGSNELSAEAKATRDVNNVIYTKLLHELDGMKKIIKVAVQNDAAAFADILAAMKKTKE
jgi:hypothetical protein